MCALAFLCYVCVLRLGCSRSLSARYPRDAHPKQHRFRTAGAACDNTQKPRMDGIATVRGCSTVAPKTRGGRSLPEPAGRVPVVRLYLSQRMPPPLHFARCGVQCRIPRESVLWLWRHGWRDRPWLTCLNSLLSRCAACCATREDFLLLHVAVSMYHGWTCLGLDLSRPAGSSPKYTRTGNCGYGLTMHKNRFGSIGLLINMYIVGKRTAFLELDRVWCSYRSREGSL